MFDLQTMRHTGQSLAAGRRHSVMFGGLQNLSLQDDTGQIDIAALALGASGQKIVRVRSTGHQVDLADDGQAVLLLPLQGQLLARLGPKDWHTDPGQAILFGSNNRSSRVTGPFEALALVLPQSLLAEGLAGHSRLPDALDFRPTAPSLSRIFRLLGDIRDLASQPNPRQPPPDRVKGLQVLVQEALVDLVLARMLGDANERQPRSALHRVLLAEEVMREHMAEPLSMDDIARDLGISLRSLQLAFRQVRQMGPRDALNLIRLDKARRLLLQARPADTVTSIALDCGVFHVSRFAAAYRLAYGEYPAETLAEAQRRTG